MVQGDASFSINTGKRNYIIKQKSEEINTPILTNIWNG